MLRDSCIDAVRQEPQSVTSVSPLLRQTHRLAVVCHKSDANAVRAELKIMFEKNAFARFSLQCEHSCPMFVRLTAMLESTIAERTALVRIVNHLATMGSVRRLQWATVPNR